MPQFCVIYKQQSANQFKKYMEIIMIYLLSIETKFKKKLEINKKIYKKYS